MNCEFEMRLPVARWLLSRGLAPVCEVQSLNNCDLVGVRFTERPVTLIEMVAVELKLRDVTGVLRQCQSHRGVNEVWAAMPHDVAMKHRPRFAEARVGLLAVALCSVERIVEATRHDGRDLSPWKSAMRRRRMEYVWRMNRRNMLRCGAPTIAVAAGGRQGAW